MTHGQQKVKSLFEILQETDALFQYSEETTAYFAQAFKSEKSANNTIEGLEKYCDSIDTLITDMKNELLEWQLKFEADPALKKAYIKLGERLTAYREKFDQPKYRAFNRRIEKAGILIPVIKPLEVKKLSHISPDEIDDYRIEVEYQFLARQAMADRKSIANLEQIKIDLGQAVTCTKRIRSEYDDFLGSKLIIAHLDENIENGDVYDIPYNKLTNFIKATEPYIG